MKCPNCGATMKDGQMYCESCGNEIQIVPEFEPEIENSIYETLSDVASEIGAQQELGAPDEVDPNEMDSVGDTVQKQDAKKKAGSGSNKKRRVKTYPFVLLGIVFLAAIALLYGFWSNQPEKLYEKAVKQMEEGTYEAALASFENAVSKSPGNSLYLNSMADCCMMLDDDVRAEELSLRALEIKADDEEAYDRLIRIYKSREDYEEINELLQNCESRDIKNRYLDFCANVPAFDMESGTYREKITVKLIANAAGTLYYTLDGSDPTRDSEVYTTPFELESGDFTIRAMFVNQYGVESNVATVWYSVDISRPEAPAVSPESGEYNAPGYISVEVPENCAVYFTTDGTDPTASSSRYEEPFWMPAGNSSFKFVVCDAGGVCGEITSRQYNLKLNAALSMEAAANQLLLTLKNAGILLNLQGDVAEKSGRNKYTYKYALTVGENHYYLYREYYEEASGNSNVTGNDYAVNYMTGECFRIMRKEDKTYELSPIAESSGESTTQGSRT